jgi:hypothetical protein
MVSQALRPGGGAPSVNSLPADDKEIVDKIATIVSVLTEGNRLR